MIILVGCRSFLSKSGRNCYIANFQIPLSQNETGLGMKTCEEWLEREVYDTITPDMIGKEVSVVKAQYLGENFARIREIKLLKK